MTIRSIVGTGAAVLIGLTVLGQSAWAVPGYVDQPINLRAGPGTDYPWIASLPQGTPTEIFGCLPGWSWCDVATEGLRGWVAGPGLQLVYDAQDVPLEGYGAQLGLPLIGFDFGNYWGRYYRGRSWYSQVDRWHGPPGRGGDHGPGWDHDGRGGEFGGGRPGGGGQPGGDHGGERPGGGGQPGGDHGGGRPGGGGQPGGDHGGGHPGGGGQPGGDHGGERPGGGGQPGGDHGGGHPGGGGQPGGDHGGGHPGGDHGGHSQ
ncbi:MAG: SH3 domain-containing protein [Janthinobacterium lividum]